MTDTDQQATRDLADASRYIRTYAKDIAAAGGGAADMSAVSAPTKQAAPAPEPIVTEKPLEREEAVRAPEPAAPTRPEVKEEKEAILARLRSRINQEPLPVMEAIKPTAPVFTQPAADVPRMPPLRPTPPPTPPPVQVSVPEPLPPVPVFAPAPPPVFTPKKPEPEVPSRLHTFKTDFADEIDSRKASTFSVLAAESNAKRREIPKAKKESKVLPVIAGSLLLIGIGAGGVYAAYLFITMPPAIPLQLLAPSLVFVDERVELEGPDYFYELAELANEPLVEGNVLLTYITYSTTSPKGLIKTPLQGGELIAAMDLPAPDILLRNIDPSSTVGIINAGGESRPFFILRANSYERTYAGMLSWEPTIARDLEDFYPAKVTAPNTVAFEEQGVSSSTTTTATTTTSSAPILPEPTFFLIFKDEVLQNHDVRILRDRQGNSIMIYGYRDKDTLIIARNEAAYLELIRRLTAGGN